MSATPPTRIGPYEILGSLGAGGMGEVYRARDTRLGRELALKVLPPDKSGSPERRQRFLQEAQAASSLNHPNIVTIYDIGSDGGLDYIAMEYVPGQTLDQITPRKGLRLSQALAYAIPIADALARAHAAGIVHRDLKPSNVMVGQGGSVKLLDFGIAKLTESTTSTGESASTATAGLGPPRTAEGIVVGTASYMSPEQAEGTEVDARSDVFSFGAMLYELLTGERAFQGGSTISTLSAVLKEEPKPIRTVTEGIPPELERVVLRCLRKDRAKRWQSMTDLKIALAELKEETDSGTLVTATGVLGAAGRQRRPTWPLWAAGVLVVLAAVLVWWRSGGPESGSPAPDAGPSDAAEAAAPEIMTNDDVIRMVRAGLSPALIADHIRASRTNFDLQTAELIRLSKSGVPEPIIGVMRQPQSAGAGPGQRQATQRAVKLGEGQALQLVLMQDLGAANLAPGNHVRLSVAQAVTVDGQLAIRKGAPASGTIVEVVGKKFFRRRPKITIRLGQVTAIDGQELRIRSKPARGGADVLTVTAKDGAGAGQATLFDAYLDESREVGGPAPAAPAAPAAGAR